jgi:hypothetical protein
VLQSEVRLVDDGGHPATVVTVAEAAVAVNPGADHTAAIGIRADDNDEILGTVQVIALSQDFGVLCMKWNAKNPPYLALAQAWRSKTPTSMNADLKLLSSS